MNGADPGAEAAFDVAVIGGGLAGGAAAWLLRQEFPDLKILVVERAARHGRRVGEATVEVSACFLMRALGLTEHLLHHHLAKQGLRFWFGQGKAGSLAEASELGGRYLARVPSFQVDRAVLDEEVLRRAGEAGAVVWRPAVVRRVDLQPGGEQLVTVEPGGETRRVRARWVVDASGFATLLARQEGWREGNTAHP
ncbi:MAG TPA: tryptophan 7-halogenase, partial [Verrucomicrobiota bacterium]|nr:tryptophan 7-halogenase [Verrucomicrobiota bacterium]